MISSSRLHAVVGALGLVALGGEPCHGTAPNDSEPAAPPVDKDHYTLVNPAPREHLRDMEALYEGPYTVDAGHFQMEMYLFGYFHDEETQGKSRIRTETWAVAPLTLKVGVLNNVDAQLAMVPHINLRVEDRTAGEVTRQSGFGDLTARAKVNLWGNDAGSTAVALTPFVRFPTSDEDLGTDGVEGGLIVPIAIELPHGFWLGFAPEFGWLRDEDGAGYHLDLSSRNYLWHELTGPLSGYIEFDPQADTEHPDEWAGVLGVGLSYRATPNLQLDAGLMFGVTRAAPDVNVFLGTSYRW